MSRISQVEGCNRKHLARGYCSAHWDRWRRTGDPGTAVVGMSPSALANSRDALLAHAVEMRSRHECWLDWPGASWSGYPVHRHHRVSHLVLQLDGRPRPDAPGDLALHSCDTPSCWNPDHLRWGSQVDNQSDARARGRLPWQRLTHCPQGHPKTAENVYESPNGSRSCRPCNREAQRRRAHAAESERVGP